MQKQEYLTVLVHYGEESVRGITSNGERVYSKNDKANQGKVFMIHEYFALLGKKGWELITASTWNNGLHFEYIFKRPVE